jgi:hypothetical protein
MDSKTWIGLSFRLGAKLGVLSRSDAAGLRRLITEMYGTE